MAIACRRNLLILLDSNIDFGAKMATLREFGCSNVNSNINILRSSLRSTLGEIMATGRSTKLTGATGEFLVSAELCRRGLIATPFSGNVPHYDIIASDEIGGHLVIQVKAERGRATVTC